MTPRERLLAFLSNELTDRVPVWLLFPYHPTSYNADVRALPGRMPRPTLHALSHRRSL